MTALQLFRSGKDTAEIASILEISEALALEQVSRERSAELRLKSPYRNYEPNLSVRRRRAA